MSIFDVVVADPPWRYQNKPNLDVGVKMGTAESHYETMATEEIMALPVKDIVADKAHLYLWVTNPLMLGLRPTIKGFATPLDIVKAWGFESKTILTWVKTTKTGDVNGGGTGWYFRGATEHVIFATRGMLSIPSELREPNVMMAPRAKHSAKPDIFYELVERVSPDTRIELFARRQRDGWLAWGNEAPGLIDINALASNPFLA